MTPFSSVAMLEKFALLRIAFCNAPVLSKVCWRRTSVRPSALGASTWGVRPLRSFLIIVPAPQLLWPTHPTPTPAVRAEELAPLLRQGDVVVVQSHCPIERQ